MIVSSYNNEHNVNHDEDWCQIQSIPHFEPIVQIQSIPIFRAWWCPLVTNKWNQAFRYYNADLLDRNLLVQRDNLHAPANGHTFLCSKWEAWTDVWPWRRSD